MLTECRAIAAALDVATATGVHCAALATAAAALDDPALTPSARVLQAMEREHDNSYVRFVLAQSKRHRETILGSPLAADVAARFARLARDSRIEERRIEAADSVPFETYRQQYLASVRLNV